MLRKEILGTKVRTESGLNKPLTLVKPNSDEDYKNQEFLDTDILLAKDIKRFVKGVDDTPMNEIIFEGEKIGYFNRTKITKDGIVLSNLYRSEEELYDEITITPTSFTMSYNVNQGASNQKTFKFDGDGVELINGSLRIRSYDYEDDIRITSKGIIYDNSDNIKLTNGSVIPSLLQYVYEDGYLRNITDVLQIKQFEYIKSTTSDYDFYIGSYIVASKSSYSSYNLYDYVIAQYQFDNKQIIYPYLAVSYSQTGRRNIEYTLMNINAIINNDKIGYYKSDGTIVSIDALKKELDITDSGNFSKPIIAYISSSEDASAEEIYKNRSLLDVAFTAYVNNVGNTSSFTVGAYCSASDEYKPSRYAIQKKDVGYNDTFIFPMFDINNSHETFVSENIDYTLRNISGIKSDDGNIGYYCSDGTVTTLDDLRTAIGTGVNISNTSTITLSQEGKSSTANLAYSGITLNQYLTSSTNHGQCKGNISGGALRLIRAYTDASGVTDLSNPDYTIYLKTDDASIRGYDKNNNGYVLTNRNQVVTIDGNDVTLNVPLLYLSGNDNNRFLATGDHLAIGDFKNTENVNNARLFVKEYVNGSYKTGLQLQGFSNNNTLPVKVGLFINNEENSSTRCGVFMENKTQDDLITANGGTKTIGIDIAAQSSITELQSQIEALTARVAALEAKQ